MALGRAMRGYGELLGRIAALVSESHEELEIGLAALPFNDRDLLRTFHNVYRFRVVPRGDHRHELGRFVADVRALIDDRNAIVHPWYERDESGLARGFKLKPNEHAVPDYDQETTDPSRLDRLAARARDLEHELETVWFGRMFASRLDAGTEEGK